MHGCEIRGRKSTRSPVSPARAPRASPAHFPPSEPPTCTARSGPRPACYKCTARRGVHRPVPVFLPVHDKVCTRHGVWFGDSEQPHLDVSACPEIIEAQHQVDRLLRGHTPQQLTLAHQAASSALPAWPASPAAISFHWRHRLLVLQTTNHPRGISGDHGSYTPAAIYPDAVRLTVLILKPHRADQHEQDPMAESARSEDVSQP